jgi:hypothetical protein
MLGPRCVSFGIIENGGIQKVIKVRDTWNSMHGCKAASGRFSDVGYTNKLRVLQRLDTASMVFSDLAAADHTNAQLLLPRFIEMHIRLRKYGNGLYRHVAIGVARTRSNDKSLVGAVAALAKT